MFAHSIKQYILEWKYQHIFIILNYWYWMENYHEIGMIQFVFPNILKYVVAVVQVQ